MFCKLACGALELGLRFAILGRYVAANRARAASVAWINGQHLRTSC